MAKYKVLSKRWQVKQGEVVEIDLTEKEERVLIQGHVLEKVEPAVETSDADAKEGSDNG